MIKFKRSDYSTNDNSTILALNLVNFHSIEKIKLYYKLFIHWSIIVLFELIVWFNNSIDDDSIA